MSPNAQTVLACDVGGTKTNLALLERDGGRLAIARFESYPSREHASLVEIVDRFVGERTPRLAAAGFGVAGPVRGSRVRTTNLPWLVDAAQLADRLGLGSVSLLNDVEAYAWAIDGLPEEDVAVMQAGEADEGNVGVIAAGTGLGLSALVRAHGRVVSLRSEGGHADWAPRSDDERGLLEHLEGRFGHVSVERVLSGPGLVDLYRWLRDTRGGAEPAFIPPALESDDPAPAITRAALDGSCPVCKRALDLFIGAYGAEAGSWALRVLATGGLYVGGGIAAKILCNEEGVRAEAREIFLASFLDKGRMRALLAQMPVRIILNPRAPLVGAASFALRAREAP